MNILDFMLAIHAVISGIDECDMVLPPLGSTDAPLIIVPATRERVMDVFIALQAEKFSPIASNWMNPQTGHMVRVVKVWND